MMRPGASHLVRVEGGGHEGVGVLPGGQGHLHSPDTQGHRKRGEEGDLPQSCSWLQSGRAVGALHRPDCRCAMLYVLRCMCCGVCAPLTSMLISLRLTYLVSLTASLVLYLHPPARMHHRDRQSWTSGQLWVSGSPLDRRHCLQTKVLSITCHHCKRRCLRAGPPLLPSSELLAVGVEQVDADGQVLTSARLAPALPHKYRPTTGRQTGI